MDGIPWDQLEYLAARIGANIADSEVEASAALLAPTELPSCTHLQRALLGEDKVLHYIICGIQPSGLRATQGSCTPLQVLINANSSMEAATLTSLLRRCLKVVVYSYGSSCSEGTCDVEDRYSSTVVPGGGAAEVGWSLLFRQLAEELRRPQLLLDEGAAETLGSASAAHLSFQPLARQLTTCLRECLRPRLLGTCACLCDAIADAYEAGPLQLILNSEGLLATGSAHSVPQILLDWKSRFCRGVHAGRVGAIVNPDESSEYALRYLV
jgi:hypothetical protein